MASRRVSIAQLALLALLALSTGVEAFSWRTLLQSPLSVQKCQWTGSTCKSSVLSALQVTGAASSAQR
jgi:hypothetical protein